MPYWYYSSLPLLERNVNQVWTSRIDFAGCEPKFFDSKELVSWCMDKYDKNQRIIQLQGESPISLAPSVFNKMLKFPDLTITFKGYEAKSFLKERNNGLELLQEYLEDPKMKPEYLSNIQVSLLKNLYREITWLFT